MEAPDQDGLLIFGANPERNVSTEAVYGSSSSSSTSPTSSKLMAILVDELRALNASIEQLRYTVDRLDKIVITYVLALSFVYFVKLSSKNRGVSIVGGYSTKTS